MKLYITPGSPYARMARIVVLEKKLESRVEIVFAKTRAAGSPYYAINPSGRVPYLVRDDGVGMEESALICDYLDRLASRRWRGACSTGWRSGVASWRVPGTSAPRA
jgi:glutathione S-transferase